MKVLETLQATLHCKHPRVWLFLLRALAKGEPVSTVALAHALGMSPQDVEVVLATFADTVYDEKGDIVACGLSLLPTPHVFRVGGKGLYTWCALDALMYPVALDQVAEVDSSCPVTGRAIRLTVGPTGVSRLFPDEAVLSVVTPTKEIGCCNVRSSFCNRVHFISSMNVAASWLSQHLDASIVSVGEAWQFGHAVMQQRMKGASTGL